MSTSLKTQDWEKSYSNYRESFQKLTIEDLCLLKECYYMLDIGDTYSFQLQAIEDELYFRSTPLGKELS
jgi:hypothetical protein